MRRIHGLLLRRILTVLLALSVQERLTAAVDADAPVEKRVIIVANSKLAESVALARHYAARRAIPPENIIALPMPALETVGWPEFIETVYQPLQDELTARGWLQGTGSSLKDVVGRKRYAFVGHHISHLVTCRGVPLRIEHSEALSAEAKPFTNNEAFRTNRGAVDAELALLAASGYPINAYVPNPLFQKERPTWLQLNKVVKVARLDGPDWEQARALVDLALEAETRGLIGRAYVDIGGPHAEGDVWLEAVAKQLEELDFDSTVDRQPATLPAEARFDAPVFYFGWYAWDVAGPFLKKDFRFPPGAVALHIHSFSAETLASRDLRWCGPLLARGVTATFGNVYEPYLTFTHHPHLLMRALARGENLGDASFHALPALSWQQVVIGDPLYRPFKQSFARQWEKRAALPDAFFPYVILREVRRLERAGQPDKALDVLREDFSERPRSEVLKSALSERLKPQPGAVVREADMHAR